MKVIELVSKYIENNGFDGLCCDGCWCASDDINSCCCSFADCKFAYANYCMTCLKRGACDRFNDIDMVYDTVKCHVSSKD